MHRMSIILLTDRLDILTYIEKGSARKDFVGEKIVVLVTKC